MGSKRMMRRLENGSKMAGIYKWFVSFLPYLHANGPQIFGCAGHVYLFGREGIKAASQN
jgi:hypothetical protein